MSTAKRFKLGNIQLTVFFAYDYIDDLSKRKPQWVTICGLRVDDEIKTYWGHATQNPCDDMDGIKGAQVAARRAFIALVNERYNGWQGCPVDEYTLRSDRYMKRKFSRFSNALHGVGAW